MFALLIVVVVLWALCGIPAALIAHFKGRNAVMWAVLGSLFGIFGLVAIAAAPAVTNGGPWDVVSGDSIYFGSSGGSGGFWDFGSGGSDFGFGDFGGSGDSGGGGCGGGGCGGGGD